MSEQDIETLKGGAKTEYDILNVLVHSAKGKRLPEKDFKLKFIKSKVSKKDITKRFDRYANNQYSKYFEEYLIPTVIKDTFITSSTVSPYKDLPKHTVLAFERPRKNINMIFEYGDYRYTKENNEFNVKYIGSNKSTISSYPFGGFSECKVNYCECFANMKITEFDFANIMMDRCVSTERMFYKCAQLTKVSNFAPHLYKIPLHDMTEMFAFCMSLSDIDLSELNQSFNLYRIQRMFYSCVSLKKIDISGLKLTGKYGDDAEVSSIFANCFGLREINCLKDHLLLIKQSLPNHRQWIDERIYRKNKSKGDKNSKQVGVSKKTKKIKYINTLFQSMIIVNDLDKENALMLVKNNVDK